MSKMLLLRLICCDLRKFEIPVRGQLLLSKTLYLSVRDCVCSSVVSDLEFPMEKQIPAENREGEAKTSVNKLSSVCIWMCLRE